MKISFIFYFFLCFIVSAKTRKPKLTTISEESFENVPFVDDALDLRGEVRARFALEAAMIESRMSMICSPMSALLPLGNLVLGAEEETKEELLAAVGLKSSKQLKPAFHHLIINMKYLQGVTLDVVSRIFISSEKNINQTFQRNSKLIFSSTSQKIDISKPRNAAHVINDWVAENTRDKIKHLVSESDIKKGTSLLLVNAIYFAGNWRHKFEKTLTKDFQSSTGPRRMTMMTREGNYKYWMSDELDAQVVEIPYEGKYVTMIIILPASSRGLQSLLRNLKRAPFLLNSALEKMKSTDVKLTIPRFKVETKLDLNSMYKKMGVNSIFSPNSRLSGIIEDEEVVVTRAIHKAVIEVNETGTEASAATAVIAGLLSPSPTTPVVFLATHPFYFVVRMYQEQLFAGTYNGG